MTSLSELRFFTTPAHDCSYLEGKQAITLFADPLAKIDKELYSSLSSVGFRRSGTHIYRPYCQSCTACIPVRLPAALFAPRRRHKRVMQANHGVSITSHEPALTEEYFKLYDSYISERHDDGDMYPASRDQFQSFLVDGRPEARFYEFRDSDKLLAVAVADELNDGLSAIYTFFDPKEDARSLGVFAILWLIEHARELELDYLYLGYWIKQCQKMSYKMDYKPIELYVNNSWIKLDS
ncbi:MAG: arginyltransferase [Pseudomonadales bacterium]|nr:arginyltransferase [Pseudomonadales bacterium]MBO6701743.1 arginyltransferase [Pseudomonadales bacterium]MBO7007268.1 arginyltransferase [Pseudomonadales bacterium]